MLLSAKAVGNRLFHSSRGHVETIDVNGLNETACECYRTIKAQCQNLRFSLLTGEVSFGHSFSYQADFEDRLSGFVQKRDFPAGIWFHLARNAAQEVAADFGQFGPRCVVVGKYRYNVRCAGKRSRLNAKEVVRQDGSFPWSGRNAGRLKTTQAWLLLNRHPMETRTITVSRVYH